MSMILEFIFRNMMPLIWGLFALIFLGLSYFHWKLSDDMINHIEIVKIEKNKLGFVYMNEYTGVDIEEPLVKFCEDFNKYLDKYNESSKKQNFLAASGYFVAFLTAVVSCYLSL